MTLKYFVSYFFQKTEFDSIGDTLHEMSCCFLEKKKKKKKKKKNKKKNNNNNKPQHIIDLSSAELD